MRGHILGSSPISLHNIVWDLELLPVESLLLLLMLFFLLLSDLFLGFHNSLPCISVIAHMLIDISIIGLEEVIVFPWQSNVTIIVPPTLNQG